MHVEPKVALRKGGGRLVRLYACNEGLRAEATMRTGSVVDGTIEDEKRPCAESIAGQMKLLFAGAF